jgi:signal transduction histidine kinase
MLGSLRARLIVSFAVVVALAVFLAGAGALLLLRDREQAAAREGYGRHAEPLNDRVSSLLELGKSRAEVEQYLIERSQALDLRLLLVDEDLLTVFDSEEALEGKYILSFENPELEVVSESGARFKWTDYRQSGENLTLFAAPPREPDPESTFAPVQYQVYVAIPRGTLASAWLDLAPRLALAGAIALAVSFAVAWFISRTISGPLARITQASVEMAKGNYDVHIPIRGQDEVGRLSEAFNAMAREVSSSQRMMRDLLANVSHELKTPLTSIQGFSQAILDDAIADEDQLRESTRIINDEANRMRGLVDDLLLLSQIESGQTVMEHANVDLQALLERTLERFQWALRDGEIRSGISIERVSPVRGDARRLEQVFSNLLQNAVRHTPPGGEITVRSSTERDGRVSVSVHNTGSYIPPADLPRVFERFFQVDRARARKGGSSGLGLAIVAEIVEAHGGTVSAKSDERTGTEFTVTLPPAAAKPRRGTRAAAAANGARPARTSAKEEKLAGNREQGTAV